MPLSLLRFACCPTVARAHSSWVLKQTSDVVVEVMHQDILKVRQQHHNVITAPFTAVRCRSLQCSSGCRGALNCESNSEEQRVKLDDLP